MKRAIPMSLGLLVLTATVRLSVGQVDSTSVLGNPLGISEPLQLIKQTSFRDGRTRGFILAGADSTHCAVLFQPALRDLRVDSTLVDWRILVCPANRYGSMGLLPDSGPCRVFTIGSPEEAVLSKMLGRLAGRYFEGVELDTLKVVARRHDLTTWQKAERVGVEVTQKRKLAFSMLRRLRAFDLERECRVQREKAAPGFPR